MNCVWWFSILVVVLKSLPWLLVTFLYLVLPRSCIVCLRVFLPYLCLRPFHFKHTLCTSSIFYIVRFLCKLFSWITVEHIKVSWKTVFHSLNIAHEP